MTNEREKPASLDDLDARLRKARAEADEAAGRKPQPEGGTSGTSGLSLALRIGVELVGALIVGCGVGLLLDYWLGTSPWLFLVFFVLGAAAGFLNVYRIAVGLGQSVGYRPSGTKKNGDDGPKG
jgi:ATP synthase protein I